MAAYQKELIETHYQEVDNMYRQMRGWRHDYRNHIQTMKAYAATEDWDAIRHYLDLLDKDLTTVDTVVKTGNAMTDAILNSKISLARSKDIQVIADADIPVKLNSSEIDLCCIIGNLFDNAIEASLQLPKEKRLIRIYMDMKNTQLYLSCFCIRCNRWIGAFLHQLVEDAFQHGFPDAKEVHGVGNQSGIAVFEQERFNALFKHWFHLARRSWQHDSCFSLLFSLAFDGTARCGSVVICKDHTAFRHHCLFFIVVCHHPV